MSGSEPHDLCSTLVLMSSVGDIKHIISEDGDELIRSDFQLKIVQI